MENKMETCRIENLYNLNETIAKDLFEGAVYPWELLPKIGAFILELGASLDLRNMRSGEKMCGWQRALL